mgnify:FL=1
MDSTQTILERPIEASQAAIEHVDDQEGFLRLDDADLYRIPRFDELPPFLMSIVSAGDLWMYVSSRGGLAAGRRSPDHALFGYETDDRLHHLYGVTGPLTLLRVSRGDQGEAVCWEPFSPVADPSRLTRRLDKGVIGDRVAFEEENGELDLTFRYAWRSCDDYGFVRTATLVNRSPDAEVDVELLDGLLNLLPAGATLALQQASSCLVDAYKVAELDRAARLAIYSLSSMVSDRPEPAESLRASVAWCRGLTSYRVLLSDRQVQSFRRGEGTREEVKLRGCRGAFLVTSRIHLRPGQSVSWDIVADVGRSQTQVARLRRFLIDEPHPHRIVHERMEADSAELARIVATHDGVQSTADRRIAVHHFANVLFNTMRGGAFADQGAVKRDDFAAFVRAWNTAAAERYHAWLARLPQSLTRNELVAAAGELNDATMLRLAREFLPLTFGRRHGDPSRPWNKFEIRVRDAGGRRKLAYQGNWRDIFQNWEALCLSFPSYVGSFIAKFVNASTVDGFNPYRLSHDGVEWETPEPNNPWSNIGYWGDHQIGYLTRLLELSQRYEPGALPSMLATRAFTYADVPYRIRPYEAMLENGRNTIEFDAARDQVIRQRASRLGADGRLMHTGEGAVLHVALAEKLLVPVLAKLSSFVPDGGIWMNTQRPEWNDANNALAGNGLSVVTLCYLRRHLALLIELFSAAAEESFPVSSTVARWMRRVDATLVEHVGLLANPQMDDASRRRVMDALGRAFCDYRAEAYGRGIGQAVPVDRETMIALLRRALQWIDRSIRNNRRPDGLYHAYNLLQLSTDGPTAMIERLPEMLEGQVAVLSSGLLDPVEAMEVIQALFDSALHTPATGSFLLYPDRPTCSFLGKNAVPRGEAERVSLLDEMLRRGDERLVVRDIEGTVRFAPELRNAAELARRLDEVSGDPGYGDVSADQRGQILRLYERVFHHHAFTGRSGSMAGYEGLGCVYWHMVAKLLVAVQEVHATAGPAEIADRLAAAYERIRGGLGFNKSAREYGAFPTDPYSHTPGQGGARQPGMTGQVKEEVITRFGELGVRVENGRLRFAPRLLCVDELHASPTRLEYFGLDGAPHVLEIPPDGLGFTVCQIPVVYRAESQEQRVLVVRPNNRVDVVPGDTLDEATTQQVIQRRGEIVRIEVMIDRRRLRPRPEKLPRFQKVVPVPAPPEAVGASGRTERVTS